MMPQILTNEGENGTPLLRDMTPEEEAVHAAELQAIAETPSPTIILNKRQFYTALALMPKPGTEERFITWEEANAAMAGNALPAALEALLLQIPSGDQREVVRGKLLHGVRFISNDELVPGIAASQNLSSEEVQAFFQFASTV
jgi:hypothetical protein